MSNSENGKNGKEKEIDRLLKLIDAVARIDTKVIGLDERIKTEIAEIKDELTTISSKLSCLETEGAKPLQIQIADIKKKLDGVCDDILDTEKRRNELITQVANLCTKADKLQESFNRWKIYWAAVAFIIAPIITTLIVIGIHIFAGLPW